jgi:predicted ribosome quality control (RQC) complex YloA/Tae2 family protein
VPVLVPARFEKAQQSDPHTVQLALRRLNGSQWLELSWLAEAPRLLAIPPPPRQGEGSTLAQQLQHSLRGLALVAIHQEGWERVVTLSFAQRPGEAPQKRLVLELMGRHSNLFLLDSTDRVVALGHQVRPGQSRLRPIGTGTAYRPPPPLGGEPPGLEETETSWRRRLQLLPLPLGKALRDAYQGISPALARQLARGACPSVPSSVAPVSLEQAVGTLTPGEWQGLWQGWRQWLTVVQTQQYALHWNGDGSFTCWGTLPGTEEPEALSINRGLATYYARELGQRQLEQRRQSVRHRLQAAAAREQQQAEQQAERLAAVPGSTMLQRQADGLLSQPNPSRDQIDRAQALYRQARKLRRSVAAIEPRLAWHRQRISWLEASLTFLDQAEDSAGLGALEEELLELQGRRSESASRRQPRRGAPGVPTPLELRTATGLRVQVGRNHRQNAWISLRQARRGDLWFHAQECPGSHVVLKASEQPAEEGDLQAAADLAAHFSRARGNVRVPVVMVPTEALQRIPGAAEGTVRHQGGEIRWGEPARALPLVEAQ